YLNIYNNYFKAPWMPDRTEANPNELNQDDARYGFRCCHLKNIWTAPLPPETELSRQMTTSTTSIDIMGLQAAYANFLDGIITTIMATIQRINIIGSREGSRNRRRLKANQTGKKFRVGIKSNISTNRN